ncbi:ABC transporter [Rhodanobacter sp. B04]|uniref:ABC transporter permease n=1 Tax=Rhodanobacter sp. B04 TaxID=1945860 RepID=UPI000985956C|nr:ABC transporter permease [Rhodanobacter sp. B04]OOG61882.1 ABC transporter [Rhodanobacter sp. B04]
MIHYYLRLAMRRSCMQPAISLLVVLTMAIGVAACMTTATIFRALEGEPLPGISDHLSVVTIDAREKMVDGNPTYTTPDSLLKLRDAIALIDAHQASGQVALAQSYAQIGNPEREQSYIANGLMAYGAVFQVLGVPLRFGRPWSESELASHAPVALIDSDLAEKLFGTEDAVGRSVQMNTHRFRVIGVTAPWKPRIAFLGAAQNMGGILASNTQLFIPIGAALDAGLGPASSGECDNGIAAVTFGTVDVQGCRWLEVWVSTTTPSAEAAYQSFLSNYAQGQHDAGRFVYPPQAELYGTRAWMALNHVVPNDVSLNLVFAGAFLLLCMMNVAGLLTARFLRRVADVAIRRALGASVRQIFEQHLIESGLLGLAGGVAALPLTWLGMWIVRKQPVGYAPIAQFSLSVFVGLAMLSLLVGMVVGILPAWRVCKLPPAMQIKES